MEDKRLRVEDEMSWYKSSYSQPNGACVDVADLPFSHAIRDSKHPHAGHLAFPPGEWDAFLTTAKRDDF